MDAPEFLTRTDLDSETLTAWIETGWLLPRVEGAGWAFSEIDLARARLICDLKRDLGVNDEGVEIVLDLVDQVHGLRRTVNVLLSAVRAQPDALRRRILADIRRGNLSRRSRETSSSRGRGPVLRGRPTPK